MKDIHEPSPERQRGLHFRAVSFEIYVYPASCEDVDVARVLRWCRRQLARATPKHDGYVLIGPLQGVPVFPKEAELDRVLSLKPEEMQEYERRFRLSGKDRPIPFYVSCNWQ